ncbi:phage holin family protein [Cereibacter azotoformans]|uniref:phage holin family protein n=1 Tax=Cereibacter azotoformans TaxID=43057 RepID=UPI000C6DEEA3|nr:phage holin family protein [Cereibacter azotoformans]
MEAPKRPLGTERSIADLLSDLVRDLTGLVRSESRLARAEIAEAGRSFAIGAELIAAGAILLLVALLVLVQALVALLAHWVGPAWAALIVGVALAAIGGILIARGRKDLSAASLVPERTIEQTSRDVRLAREQI